MQNLDARDPLALGQQLMSVLEGGRRTATYKLATLLALLDHAVESTPADPDAALDVDLNDLADRVIELYWRQVRDLDGHYLRQSTNPHARIPDAVRALKLATSSPRFEIAVDVARRRDPELYSSTRDTVKLTLVQQPLHRLQRVTKDQEHTCFLYDDSWMHDKVSTAAIAQQDNVIRLFPGVCHALARLSALLKPALQIAWVDDVRRLNSFLRDDTPDLAGHLFGMDRVSLNRARGALAHEFGPQCFYCQTTVSTGAHVDHVLPWSRVGIDGLSNLVLACARCNGDKSNLLPAPFHVHNALDRGQSTLDALAASIDWPSQYERTAAAARGLYSTQPPKTPMWLGRRSIELLPPDFQWSVPRATWSTTL